MTSHKPADKKDALSETIGQIAGEEIVDMDAKKKAHMDALGNRWKKK